MVQPQPPKFALEVKCRCRGCRDRYARENTIPKFQRLLAAQYGLQHSSYNEMNGTLEIIGEVDDNNLEELTRLFRNHTSKKKSSSWCCFWASSKNKEDATCNTPLPNARPLRSLPNDDDNNPRTKDAKTQTEDDIDRRHRRCDKEEEKQEKGPVDARDKGKGKIGDGSCSKQAKGKGIKLGNDLRAKGVKIKSEGDQKDQRGEIPPRGSDQRAEVGRDQRGTNMQAIPQTNVMVLDGYVIPFGDRTAEWAWHY